MPIDLHKMKELFNHERAGLVSEGLVGYWAVITDSGVKGSHATFEGAMQAALERFAPGEFSIDEIQPTERVEVVSRVGWA